MKPLLWFVSLAIAGLPLPVFANELSELAGIWEARNNYGPEIRGTLDVFRRGDDWSAEIAGRRAVVSRTRDELNFSLPGNLGQFRGQLEDGEIVGHWVQPKLLRAGLESASPVLLMSVGVDHWRGTVRPREDRFVFYLVLAETDDGMSAFLRNPERNQGRILNLSRVTRSQKDLTFHGRFFGRGDEQPLLEGVYRENSDVISMEIAWLGTFDFHRHRLAVFLVQARLRIERIDMRNAPGHVTENHILGSRREVRRPYGLAGRSS